MNERVCARNKRWKEYTQIFVKKKKKKKKKHEKPSSFYSLSKSFFPFIIKKKNETNT